MSVYDKYSAQTTKFHYCSLYICEGDHLVNTDNYYNIFISEILIRPIEQTCRYYGMCVHMCTIMDPRYSSIINYALMNSLHSNRQPYIQVVLSVYSHEPKV